MIFSPSLLAKEHVVKLLTVDEQGKSMVMQPSYIRIDKGDSIKFVPSDVTHNAQSIVTPEGAKSFTTEMGKTQTVIFPIEGAYLYKCTPHFALGMLGVVQVGSANNVEQLKAHWESIKSNIVLNQSLVDEAVNQIN